MKKVAYVVGGILIGVVISTTGSAFADTVKSMVGKKVSGEYSVIVNGEKLSEKGAIIDSKANVPARSLSEALGADVKVSGKTITITTEQSNTVETGSGPNNVSTTNKYIGGTKSSLETMRDSLKNQTIAPLEKAREDVSRWLSESKEQGNDLAVDQWTKELARYDSDIAKYSEELKLVEEALAEIK
ncbi:stalk domain-containing protein [Paenibacillus xylanilyticus]|uniref:Copper amine oxidase n=1 Tax=Paenibacillus xylanilyticus TaxID=248903 RepID=A0A7Y6ETK0_9BACL|nr:stalk domain-containing protein [Paenibacillus xylanilyticus]NUU73913.1 copper amine oxidase [Paenibacillus xylanilyticus]